MIGNDKNIFMFRRYRGRGLDVLFYAGGILWILAWVPAIILVLLSAEYDGYLHLLLPYIFTVLCVFGTFFCLKDILVRKLRITLAEDHVIIEEVKIFFLKQNVLRFYYSDMADCRVVTSIFRGPSDYLHIKMNNGYCYRIMDALSLFKKIEDYTQIFSINDVAVLYEKYRTAS